MAEHNDLGKLGEEIAKQFLISKGYSILASNWRYRREEIDIIAENDNYVAIVEVKTRTSDQFGEPQDFITPSKKRHLIQAANSYAETMNIEKDIYFDIIAIVLEPQEQIEHICQAFYP